MNIGVMNAGTERDATRAVAARTEGRAQMSITRRMFLGSAFALTSWVRAMAVGADEEPLPVPDPATGFVTERFGSWGYAAGRDPDDGQLDVVVFPDVTSAATLLAFDAANRAAVGQVTAPTPVTVTLRRPLSGDEVAALARAAGVPITGYTARYVEDQGLRATLSSAGAPPEAGGRPMATIAPTPTRPDSTPTPPNPRVGFRGYITLDVTADAGQIATLLADDRVFTVDVVRVIAVARGRAALIASDPTFAALPLRLTVQTPLYW